MQSISKSAIHCLISMPVCNHHPNSAGYYSFKMVISMTDHISKGYHIYCLPADSKGPLHILNYCDMSHYHWMMYRLGFFPLVCIKKLCVQLFEIFVWIFWEIPWSQCFKGPNQNPNSLIGVWLQKNVILPKTLWPNLENLMLEFPGGSTYQYFAAL